jgi:hypothetical protein
MTADQVKALVLSLWSRLRAAATTYEGDAVMAEWVAAAAGVDDEIARVRRLISSSMIVSSGLPTSGDDADRFAADYWRGSGSTAIANGRLFGWLLSLRDDLIEARAFWGLRMAQFAAALSVDAAKSTGALADVVTGISEDVAIVSDTLLVVAAAVDLPPEVRAQIEADLTAVSARRRAEIETLRGIVSGLDDLIARAEAGTLPVYVPLVAPSSDVPPILVWAGVSGLILAVLKGGKF